MAARSLVPDGLLARAAVIRVLIIVSFAAASYRDILLSWSDWESRRGSAAGLRKAESIMPSNGRFHFLNALAIEQRDPLSSEIPHEFAMAVAANPRYSDAMLAWSVNAEFHGDKKSAEELLLRAQKIDRLIQPAWALANFYFRQGDAERFWPQARECLRMIGATGLAVGRFDPNPIYQLCWQMTSDARVILVRAIPEDRVIRDHYFSFLMASGRLDAAKAVANLNLQGANAGELVFYLPYLNALIAHNDLALAIETWRRLYDQGLVPYPGPNPEKGIFLTDAKLAGKPLNAGFDWRFGFPDAIQFTYEQEHGFRFEFDGSEPQRFLMMAQVVPVLPGRNYRFTAKYKSDFDPESSGLRWSAADHQSLKLLPMKVTESGSGANNNDEKTISQTFQAPSGVTCLNFSLNYERQIGTPRAKGVFYLMHTSLLLVGGLR